MTKRQNIMIAAIGYTLIGLIAFGHCAAERREASEQCEARFNVTNTLEHKAVTQRCSNFAPVSALFAGALWPLYLSWELQS